MWAPSTCTWPAGPEGEEEGRGEGGGGTAGGEGRRRGKGHMCLHRVLVQTLHQRTAHSLNFSG